MNKEISRRDFIKVASATSGAVALAAFGIERKRRQDEIAVRVEELRTERILNTPETGKYNSEALRKWTEISPQPKLDSKLDVAITPSRIVRGEGSVEWHLDVATKLGFQSVSIPISPPEHQDHTGIETPIDMPLYELIQRPYFDKVFSHPEIKRVHITCDVGKPESANGWQFPGSEFSEKALQSTYEEYKKTAEFLLENYGDLDKEIVIGGPNEVDLLGKGGYSPATEDEDMPERAIKNAVSYFNTVYQAVKDANEANPDKKALKTGIEVIQIRSEIEKGEARNALDIVAGLDEAPDEVGLSAWQFIGKPNSFWIEKAVELIRNEAPNSKAVISEYGVPDGERPGLSKAEVAELYSRDIKTAFDEGASNFTIWSLTGYDSEINFPDNDEIRGLGLIRPDGSFRLDVYNTLREISGVEKIKNYYE